MDLSWKHFVYKEYRENPKRTCWIRENYCSKLFNNSVSSGQDISAFICMEMWTYMVTHCNVFTCVDLDNKS